MNIETVKSLGKYFLRRTKQNELFTHAAALSYSSVLAVVPVLALAYFSFSVLDGFSKLEVYIESYIFENLAPSFADNIRTYLDQIKSSISANAIGVFGLATFALTSVLTISKIEDSLNRIWGIARSRGLLKKIIVYWGVLSLAPVLLGSSFYLSNQTMNALKIEGAVEWFGIVLGGFLPLMFSGLAFSFLYWLLPNFKVKKRAAFASGFVTAFVFEIAKQLYSYYAAVALGNSFYGSLAVLPVFLVWLYVVWLIVLVGAELCVFLQYRLQGGSWNVTGKLYQPFLMVDLLQRVHLQNERYSNQSIELSQIIEEFDVAPEELIRHLVWLEQEHFIIPVNIAGIEGYCYAPSIRDQNKNLERFFKKFVSLDYSCNESWAKKIQNQYYSSSFYD